MCHPNTNVHYTIVSIFRVDGIRPAAPIRKYRRHHRPIDTPSRLPHLTSFPRLNRIRATKENVMSETSPTRRDVLASSAAAGAVSLLSGNSAAAADDNTLRPFRINVPEEALVDLRRRIAATRWPEKETVADESQGVRLATVQQLAQYWQTSHDWRKVEARLNALPQFITEIDGLDIHFIHVRSKHENALPMIVTHGWPGSVIELLKIID